MNDSFTPPSCDSKIDDPLSEEQFHRIAKAIADPQRFAILSCIAATTEIPCKTLVAEFPVTQATISHHLKELVAANLIHSRREGQMAILSCRRDVCDAYARYLVRRLVTPADRSER
ncbi:ArsR/SmtB family transcription factor [Rubripirellula reticaptiva]|uniref:Helix-turn-helix domain protein n=1 Tax=Rubripirellula reticaptiva TaxID=2528013 RepID=A0A5C6EMH9_9BACT|nr:metalloregulator ArsR/SmtB family transcription factor [Rubripirellula reticaptiva]TWU49554.1 Helix-turn-helix domain protein [Rubripirellula reticaptiva]